MSVQIRLGHTDSVNSVDRQNFLDVELKNTSKPFHFTDIKATIDQYEQFKAERENCNKYRLILTINPYCTNVLFNTFTEVVYAEGAGKLYDKNNVLIFDGCNSVVDGDTFNDENSEKASSIKNDGSVYGLTTPNRVQMVMNTEYSKPGTANDSKDINGRVITDENYVYHPGYDIFDNHILRNKSFKIVNKFHKNSSLSEDDKKFFNTIADKFRYADGSQIRYKRRDSLEDDIKKDLDRHLYDYADILQFENGDAINANLTEENGWYGFINNSTIQSRNSDKNFEELGIGRVLNDHKSCEFIDMYPDRTLYSFNPKYNKYRHREEYNWEVILTYPYSKDKILFLTDFETYVVIKRKEDNIIDEEKYIGKRTALTILSAVKTIAPNGETVILFRSMTKHGLKRGDYVYFYYKEKNSEENKWYQYEKRFIVRNIGDLENNKKEYYFCINDMDFIRSLDESMDNVPDSELDVDDNYEYRFGRVVGNVPSRYYFRKFKKLPNFKFAKRNFPKDGSMTIDNYIKGYAVDKNGKMVLFDKEQYKLAFESTIYNDDSTQITFTDTIDIDNLVDDRGCPITEIYATIIKTNYGHDKWYGDNPDKRADSDVEFSHCFGPVSVGLQFSQEKAESVFTTDKRQSNGDVCKLYNGSSPYPDNVIDRINGNNVSVFNDTFYGDMVEFNPNECLEKPLQSFMYRFNTAQRELGEEVEDNKIRKFHWHEIWSDDWDLKPIERTEDIITEKGKVTDYFSVIENKADDDTATKRSEGYYYQPHYRIPLREFGEVVQGQHYDININKIEPVQADGIYLKITTIRRSGVNKGDIVYLCDDKNDVRYEFIVTYVENRVTFYILPYTKEKVNPWGYFKEKSRMNWLDVCNLAVPYVPEDKSETGRDALLFFRIKNEEIPDYAEKVGKNKYLWRNVLRVGDMNIKELPEYAYSNNAFYISKEINFFLKRQDPQGWNGLHCKAGFPNDIAGNIKKESNYIYKEEKETIC